MKVYRVQHKTRTVGPLCYQGSTIHGSGWSAFAKDHDTPEEVDLELHIKHFPDGVKRKHRFGVTTYEQLDNLFYVENREKLRDKDFRAIEVEVPDEHCVVFPDGQIIYDGTKVQSLRTLKDFMPKVLKPATIFESVYYS